MTNDENLAAVGRDILFSGRAQLGAALPYMSAALYALLPAPGDSVTTSAATDGEMLWYNAAFLASGFMKSERFSPRLNLHMTLHCLFRHLAKRRGRDAALWDLACDAAVESVIDSLPYACVAQRASPPKQFFLTECRRELKVLSAEGIYRLLLRLRLPEYKIASLQRLFAMDDHSLWDLEEKKERARSERQDQHWQNAASNAQTALDSLVSEQGAVWAPLPAKFEAGTQDGAGIVALGAAVSYLEGIGMAAVEERERLLAAALTDALASLPFIDIVGPVDGARRGPSLRRAAPQASGRELHVPREHRALQRPVRHRPARQRPRVSLEGVQWLR